MCVGLAISAAAPRLSLLRVKAASEDTSASGDELIEELKAKVCHNNPARIRVCTRCS